MSKTYTDEESGNQIHIKTNHQPRPILSAYELTDRERENVFHDDDTGFRYRGEFYNFNEFVYLPGFLGSLGWDGGCAESYFSAVVFKYVNEDEVIVGYAHW